MILGGLERINWLCVYSYGKNKFEIRSTRDTNMILERIKIVSRASTVRVLNVVGILQKFRQLYQAAVAIAGHCCDVMVKTKTNIKTNIQMNKFVFCVTIAL